MGTIYLASSCSSLSSSINCEWLEELALISSEDYCSSSKESMIFLGGDFFVISNSFVLSLRIK